MKPIIKISGLCILLTCLYVSATQLGVYVNSEAGTITELNLQVEDSNVMYQSDPLQLPIRQSLSSKEEVIANVDVQYLLPGYLIKEMYEHSFYAVYDDSSNTTFSLYYEIKE